jgi:hypothetical protein
MKNTYKLSVRGMTFEGSAHKLSDDEVQRLVDFKEENCSQSWTELYNELPKLLTGYDPQETNWWHAVRPCLDQALHFVLSDDGGQIFWDRKLDEIGELYDLHEKYNLPDGFEDTKESFDAVPAEGQENILFTYEMLKGIFGSYIIESTEVPQPKDFAIVPISIETPEYEVELLEKIFYKNQELEPDFDDEWVRGKQLIVEVFTSESLSSDEDDDF